MPNRNGRGGPAGERPIARLFDYLNDSTWSRRRGARDVMDFMLGNSQEMPLPDVTSALKYWSDPLTKDWYGYRASEANAREISANSLRQRTGVPFEPEDIAMTNGAFGALAVGLRLVTDPGDEVIVPRPAWSFYEPLLRDAGVVSIHVNVCPETFDLDVAGISRAVTPRTRAVVINSPHSPTGRIYTRESLQQLAEILEEASRRNGRRIFLISDEVFARIVFDGLRAISPAEIYDHTLVVYSWSKQLLAPGHRIGYLAIHPRMPERQELREDLFMTQIAGGYVFPSAVLQHSLGDLEAVTIDLEHLQRKRDRMVEVLTSAGYDVQPPDGTFYLLVRAPIANDRRFADMLAARDVFVLPGDLFEYPGYFRVSLTASDDMIERSLSHFEAVYRQCLLAEKVASV
ncbi:MAG: aminotransferase class I/II-fold pyridoxal phosphate-dependent enzyme [Thermomicrobiales bacterium]